MFSSIPNMPPTASSVLSTYTSYYATLMLIRSMANELIPGPLRYGLKSAFRYLFTPLSHNLTIVIDEKSGMNLNEVYEAAEIYLQTKISPNAAMLKASKTSKQNKIDVTMWKGEEVTDTYENIKLKWRFTAIEPQKSNDNYSPGKKYFELTFHKKFKQQVIENYLPFVLAKSKELRVGNKALKIFTTDHRDYHRLDGGNGVWGSVNLNHPATFDTLAMEPEMKKAIIEDLDRFVRRREYYKKVGKAWKRGYLLYGPPGTGKSSLIAAMANYLKFDIYDLDLTRVGCNSTLRNMLLSTTNKSIMVIEDIDCSVELHDRELPNRVNNPSKTRLTLSGVLNFIDGLWSSCGDERIIIFTTNHKDRLDPALLRPGRMDMHIHMSYLTNPGFNLLASNYLGLSSDVPHQTFGEIKELIDEVQVTPAEVAEELMKSEDVDVALGGVVNFLKRKREEAKEDEKSRKEEEASRVKEPEAKRVKRLPLSGYLDEDEDMWM